MTPYLKNESTREHRMLNIASALVSLYIAPKRVEAIRLRDLRAMILREIKVTPKSATGDLKANGDALGGHGLDLNTFEMNGDRWVWVDVNMAAVSEFLRDGSRGERIVKPGITALTPGDYAIVYTQLLTFQALRTPAAIGETFKVKRGRSVVAEAGIITFADGKTAIDAGRFLHFSKPRICHYSKSGFEIDFTTTEKDEDSVRLIRQVLTKFFATRLCED